MDKKIEDIIEKVESKIAEIETEATEIAEEVGSILEEDAVIELLKLIKIRSQEDYRRRRPLNLDKIRSDLTELRRFLAYFFPPQMDLGIREDSLKGVHCYRSDYDAGTQRNILYFHGGGYIFERTNHAREIHIALACAANIWVPEYRLAPEYPYPAALEDAYTSYLGLLDRGIEPHNIFVMGDSAGGGLALGLLLKLRDDGIPLPKACIVMSPWADLSLTGDSLVTREPSDPLLSSVVLKEVADLILQGHSPQDPYISPVYGDYTGLPPLLVLVGGREILFDDARRVVEAALRDHVDATLDIEHRMIHVYPLFNVVFEEATLAVNRIAAFVKKVDPR